MESFKKVIKLKLIYIKNSKTKYIQDFENDLIKRMQNLIKIEMITILNKKKFSTKKELIKYEASLIKNELKKNQEFYCFDNNGESFNS